MAAPEHDWSGPYIGVHAGYGRFDSNVDFDPISNNFTNKINAGRVPPGLDHQADGFLGGAQLGYNHQIDMFVLGAEVDASFTGIDGAGSFTSTLGLRDHTTIETTSIDWMSTLRLRGGVAMTPDMLLYATGGAAIADVQRTGSVVRLDNGNTWLHSEDEIRYGWTVGAGVEVALTETVSLKGEYLYVDLGTSSSTYFRDNGNPTQHMDSNNDLTGHMGRIGINVALY